MEFMINDKAEFDAKIKEGKVLVDFFAVWCGPCSMLAPLVEKVGEEHPEITVIKVDVDQAPEIASVYSIYSIPTLLLFENGELKRKQVGYIPEPSLKRFLGINE